jgi:hypothetical protein
MWMLFAVIIVGVIIACVLAALKKQQPAGGGELSFEQRTPLFSPAERSFFGVLEQAVGSGYRVFGKVRLGDIVKPGKGLSKSKWATASNMLNKKHLDFVVCTASDLSVVGVVELDDRSHERQDRANRDVFVDGALAGAEVPVARFSAKKGYALPEVRSKIVETFKIASVQAILTPIREVPRPVQLTPVQPVEKPVQQVEPTAPACPKCAAPMVKRQAKTGPNAGNFFWACSTFPKCRQAVAID